MTTFVQSNWFTQKFPQWKQKMLIRDRVVVANSELTTVDSIISINTISRFNSEMSLSSCRPQFSRNKANNFTILFIKFYLYSFWHLRCFNKIRLHDSRTSEKNLLNIKFYNCDKSCEYLITEISLRNELNSKFWWFI